MQGRNLSMVDPQKVFAIGYCFGGGSVLELIRSNSTPGLLGAPHALDHCVPLWTCSRMNALAGLHLAWLMMLA